MKSFFSITAALGATAAFHLPASLPSSPTRLSKIMQPPRLPSSPARPSFRTRRHEGTREKTLLGRFSSSTLNSHSRTASATRHSHDDDAQYRLEQKTWMFQDKYPIAYEVASVDSDDGDAVTVPILLLNGFGVGSFHQHRLMRQLLIEQHQQQQERPQSQKKQFVIYGIDYLGQGNSWPKDPQDGNSPDEYQLAYSADMWLSQLVSFVQEVILSPQTKSESKSTARNKINNKSNKVHLVGNSVGGYLATFLTSQHPHLISSLTLLNATPVWGLNLPGWDGKLPAPVVPKAVGRLLFDLIRNENVILEYLDTAYVCSEAHDGSFVDSFDGWGCRSSSRSGSRSSISGSKDDGGDGGNNNNEKGGVPLGLRIRACTEGNGGHAAFASILFSGPVSGGDSFYDALQHIPVDVLLLFGEDDPWCTQAVGKRMHITLASRENENGGAAASQRFVTLKNVGHCPNHEAPTAVARVLIPWLNAGDSEQRRLVPLILQDRIQEPWGEVLIREVSIEESESLGLVDRFVSKMVG